MVINFLGPWQVRISCLFNKTKVWFCDNHEWSGVYLGTRQCPVHTQHIFSCDNWILFFCQTQGNNRSSNLISNVLNVDVRGIYILDEGFCVGPDDGLLMFNWLLLELCRCLDWSQLCRSDDILPRVSFKVSCTKNLTLSVIITSVLEGMKGFWVESGAATSHNPPDLDPSLQSHSSHFSWGQGEKKVGIKINQTSIHFPAI